MGCTSKCWGSWALYLQGHSINFKKSCWLAKILEKNQRHSLQWGGDLGNGRPVSCILSPGKGDWANNPVNLFFLGQCSTPSANLQTKTKLEGSCGANILLGCIRSVASQLREYWVQLWGLPGQGRHEHTGVNSGKGYDDNRSLGHAWKGWESCSTWRLEGLGVS